MFREALEKHPWDLGPEEALQLQRRLAEQVVVQPLAGHPRYVAGVDSVFSDDERNCLAAAVLVDLTTGKVVAEATAAVPTGMDYVPGLLSFREGAALLEALDGLPQIPNAIMFDGHGLAHPRRLGIASHLGVLTGLPTLGCGKSRLVGSYDEPDGARGASTPLIDDGRRVGDVVRTRDDVHCVFISPGHLMNCDDALALALACARGYRIPEPTRQADILAARFKRKFSAPA